MSEGSATPEVTIEVTFPLIGRLAERGVNADAVVMRMIREAFQGSGEMRSTFDGAYVGMRGPERREATETSARLSVSVGGVSFSGTTVTGYASDEARGLCEARADRALPAVDAYRLAYDPGEDDDCVIADMLADLMHLSSVRGLGWDAMLRKARTHAEAERAGE